MRNLIFIPGFICHVLHKQFSLDRKAMIEKGRPWALPQSFAKNAKILQSRFDTREWCANFLAQQGFTIPNQDGSSSSSKKLKTYKINNEKTYQALVGYG